MPETPRLRFGLSAATPILANGSYVLDIAAYAIVLPQISREIGLSQERAVWLYSSYSVTVLITILAGGWLGDRWRIGNVFAVGLMLYFVGAASLLTAMDFQSLVTGRILQGFGAGLFAPMTPVLLAAIGPDASARMLSIWAVCSGVIAAIAPLGFAMVADEFGWRGAWSSIPLVAALALALTLLFRLDAKSETSGSRFPTSWRFWMIMLYVFCTYGITTWFMYAAPFRFEVRSKDTFEVGGALSVLWICFALVSAGMARRTEIRQLLTYLATGVALEALGVVLFVALPGSLTLWLGAGLVGTGMALNNVPTTVFAFRFAPKSARGLAASFDIVSARLGGALAVALILPNGDNFWIFSILCTASLFSLIVVAIISATRPDH